MATLDDETTGMIIIKGTVPTDEFKEFIRKLVREEVAAVLAEQEKTRGWQPVQERK